MRAAHSRFGPSGQCSSLAGSRGLFRQEGLQGSVAAHPRGDRCVQQVTCEEDRAFSRDLLKREDTSPEQRLAEWWIVTFTDEAWSFSTSAMVMRPFDAFAQPSAAQGALIARAKSLELNTPYVPPPGDALEHHAS